MGETTDDLEAFKESLQAFDQVSRTACNTLDLIVSAVDRVEAVCEPVVALTEGLRLSHRNVQSVHKELTNIDRYLSVGDNINECLERLTTAANGTSMETAFVDGHKDLDTLTDVLLEAEVFLTGNDFLPGAKDKVSKLYITKTKCKKWYLEQLSLLACQAVLLTSSTLGSDVLSDSLPNPGESGTSSFYERLGFAGVPSSSQGLVKTLIKLQATSEMISTYVESRYPIVLERFRSLCGAELSDSVPAVSQESSESKYVHALICVFAEEARFIHAVFGINTGPASMNDQVEIDRRSASKACLRGVMQSGAVAPFLQVTQALIARVAFTSDEYQTVVDLSQSYYSCLASSSDSSWNTPTNSSTASAVADAQVALTVSDMVFQNMENGTFLEICHLVASAELAAQNVALTVVGSHVGPAMKLVKEALKKVSSRKLLQNTFALLQLPSFLRLGADLLRATDPAGESAINPAIRIGLKFATVDVRFAVVEKLLQEVGRVTHAYELGVCQALIEASMSFRHLDPSLFTLSDSRAAALQKMMIMVSMLKRSPLTPYKLRQDYICAASAVLSGTPHSAASLSPPVPAAFSESALKAEVTALQRQAVPSLVQVSALTISINNLSFLRAEINSVDDDGELSSVISEHLEVVGEAFVRELVAVFNAHTILPLPNVPSDIATRKPNTTSAFCRDLKARFGAVNSFIDSVQSRGNPPPENIIDVQTRNKLKSLAAEALTVKYTPFYESFAPIRFSKKHQNEYTRWPPDAALEILVGPVDELRETN